MKINVLVKPNSRRELVKQLPDGSFEVRINAPAVEGRANEAVIEALARYFSVTKFSVNIAHGSKGKRKMVEIIG